MRPCLSGASNGASAWLSRAHSRIGQQRPPGVCWIANSTSVGARTVGVLGLPSWWFPYVDAEGDACALSQLCPVSGTSAFTIGVSCGGPHRQERCPWPLNPEHRSYLGAERRRVARSQAGQAASPDVATPNAGVETLGPLIGLAGAWEGEKGSSVSTSRPGMDVGVVRYRELVTFTPFGPVGLDAPHLYGLEYKMSAWKLTEGGDRRTNVNGVAFHTEVGYWMWSPERDQVTKGFVTPRGSAVLAAGPSWRHREPVHAPRRR